MKVMIASDIHGSAEFCGHLMDAYNNEEPDRLLLLGDLLYHGPRNNLPNDYDTKQTMAMLNSLKDEITAVRGNCDSEVDQMVLEFPIMQTYSLLDFDGYKFFAAHGHNYSPDNPPPFVDFDVLLNGHTHVSMLVDCGDYIYANPGSTSIPKGGTTHSYMVYEDGRLTIKNLITMDEIESIYINNKSE